MLYPLSYEGGAGRKRGTKPSAQAGLGPGTAYDQRIAALRDADRLVRSRDPRVRARGRSR
jgi:hypothetical protein